ncbi:DUF2637 domain-containing protein [Streptomyces sp. WMMC500]|uniref:DUF2637 domain-containing protein n=1 Tax=Streptomyces sp. WMMC500 TaxID=3015154 RepID=UPI00248B656D|nr:DUF2637 domain-containing protein [Streptomyces sp. WMMC500]WBB64515.1 DUF2637 domain-containing protein [Streptomyces sp. WMMC500]
MNRTHRILIAVVILGAVVIAAIGFAGSYAAVRDLAEKKGFGDFAVFFPIGIDAGIVVLLALDLLLTWIRIPFPLLRQAAWLLTAATIAFNGAAAWPDPLGVGMHAIIPVLFVVAVEAARHAIGRIADITADKYMEGVRVSRWLLAFPSTFRLWRRMKLWELRSYEEVIRLEQDRMVYRARLRARYGRAWRRRAPVEAVMPLKLARYGVPLAETAPEGLAAAGIDKPLRPQSAQAELTAGRPAAGEAREAGEYAGGAPGQQGGAPGPVQVTQPAQAAQTPQEVPTAQTVPLAQTAAAAPQAQAVPTAEAAHAAQAAYAAPTAPTAQAVYPTPAATAPYAEPAPPAPLPEPAPLPVPEPVATIPGPAPRRDLRAPVAVNGHPRSAPQPPSFVAPPPSYPEPEPEPEPEPAAADDLGEVVGLPDGVPYDDALFGYYRQFVLDEGRFPSPRPFGRYLRDVHGVMYADGSTLSEPYLRTYLPELKARYNQDMGTA